MLHQAAHHIELVIAREEQRALGQRCLATAIHTHEMLNDVSHALATENFAPQVGAAMPVRVRWVAGTVVVPLVERQEEGRGARQPGGHIDLVGIHRHVYQAAAKLQQRLAAVTFLLVLPLTVIAGCLPSPGVLQLQRGEGQAVDEEHHIQLFQGVAQGVTHLARAAEDIGYELLFDSLRAVGQRRRVHQVEVYIVDGQAALEQM